MIYAIRSELICRVKWNNSLPDLPFDPKFITYPFEGDRFVKYKQTSLERTYKHDLVTEHDLGVTIDLINPDTYAPSATPSYITVEDERLLEDDTNASLPSNMSAKDEKRHLQHNKVVPWLKKTEYISTEFNRYGASSEKNETKVGYNVKKKFKEDLLYQDRESQIAQINKTFEEAKKPITQYHHPKKDVVPVAVYPVFPDFESWKYPFAQVTFDQDPVSSINNAETTEEMSEAMIRGMMDERGEQFVAYFLPTKDTLGKRRRDKDQGQDYEVEDEYEYKMAREYNWNVKNKNNKGYEENYFFVFRDDCIFYNELETRVRLSKRRAKVGTGTANSKLIVRHRALNDQEFKTQELRMTQLMPAPQEEEVREEMDREKRAKEAEARRASQEEEDAQKKSGDEEEDERPAKKQKTGNKVSSGSDSSSSSASSSASSSSSGSESESEDDDKVKKAKKDEAEIFGSDDSD